MSRIGKAPVIIPGGTTVTLDGNIVMAKGPKGELKMDVHPEMQVTINDSEILVTRPSDHRNHRSLHGLTRNLINNMVIGVSQGFEKKLEVSGVGYKAASEGNKLTLNVGYSHPIVMEIPTGLSVAVEKATITVQGIDKQQLGQFAANIRKVRPPEPYKGHGIKYATEVIRRKAGKRGV
ncbi:MAG: 50S ribosomal protein L6 [Candidatus Wallbacteria bacterium HGW-Wallbacteria-1]|jgi:large subunit ribosomal protein L6|uniref:Large ribosomal subunit protein uL6 n=1 Tax=Candidatus Wallbacteria bacterium HGW-Wallbacteria-1 TaxID=2013854 RepID=A0A2N1PSW7_9BACT|nr:MAG: 50S ribosomal protein L6 [Candidatus Wallbacteria bacterium HGW-Wallbacteria-1]